VTTPKADPVDVDEELGEMLRAALRFYDGVVVPIGKEVLRQLAAPPGPSARRRFRRSRHALLARAIFSRRRARP